MDMRATLLVSDDLMFSLQGKFTIIGIYTTDIGIATDEQFTSQLVFTFIVELDLNGLPSTLTLEVVLPGDGPRHMIVPIVRPVFVPENRKQIVLRLPFLVSNPILRPGRITARVLYPGGEISTIGIWIAKATPAPQSETIN